MQKYSVNQYPVSTILAWVQSDEIAIPEIQRPFVWSSVKVRDLIDSLYNGYPIGYIIAWKNPNIHLKDGSLSLGKKILIDGQQRIAALRASILGEKIIDKEYKDTKITIAFNPITEEFATLTPAIEKDSAWVIDISKLINREGGLLTYVRHYLTKNPDLNRKKIERSIEKLLEIRNKPVGFIELDPDLDIDTVTEIFIRINSKGVVLSQVDFAMAKIASYGDFGTNLRKFIDYFCHLAREPKFYRFISENDQGFHKTDYLNKISWLKSETDNLYDPDYGDVIRVCFTHKFERGKMSELVSLLSGRNFETRSFEQRIIDNTFRQFRDGVTEFVNETHFKRFLMIIRSAGFIHRSLINSQNPLNFAYVLFLKMRDKNMRPGLIEKYVRRWFVMSVLTGRYSGSVESNFDKDIKSISEKNVMGYLEEIEEAELSKAFWEIGLVQALDSAVINNPVLNVFFAAQVKANEKGFLSSDITVSDLISQKGDVHHIFPKGYLQKKYNSKTDYNQIANFVYAQSEINIQIGNKSPKDYFKEIIKQCKSKRAKYGNICREEELNRNLKKNCIPQEVMEMEIDDYFDFLAARRKLMAKKIEKYYKSL